MKELIASQRERLAAIEIRCMLPNGPMCPRSARTQVGPELSVPLRDQIGSDTASAEPTSKSAGNLLSRRTFDTATATDAGDDTGAIENVSTFNICFAGQMLTQTQTRAAVESELPTERPTEQTKLPLVTDSNNNSSGRAHSFAPSESLSLPNDPRRRWVVGKF